MGDPHVPGTRRVEAELRTSASPDAVWSAWAEPERTAQWFVDRAAGSAQPGDTLVWLWESFGEVRYRVEAAEAPRRLVLASAQPPEVLEVTIRREGGQTVLRVVNSGFLDAPEYDDVVAGVRSGWTLALAVLREYLERAFGRPKRTFLHERSARFEYGDMMRRFETVVAGDVLTLPGLAPQRVRRIARTDSELSVAFDAHRTVFELKAYVIAPGVGDQRTVAVRGTTWDDDASFGALEAAAVHLLDDLAAEAGARSQRDRV